MEKINKSGWKIPWKGISVALLCSALALFFVFSRLAKPAEILRELKSYPLGYFFAAQFFVLIAWIVDGQRVSMLTKAFGHTISLWELTAVLGAANFLTLVTPFAGGGGALVIYFLYRRGFPTATATALVIAGGIAGQIGLSVLSLLLFSTVSSSQSGLARYLPYLSAGALVYLLALLVLLFLITKHDLFFQWIFRKKGAQSRTAQWLAEFRATFRLLLGPRRRYYGACLLMALCYYAVYYLGGFVLLSGFGLYQPWLRYAVSVFFGIAPVFSPIPGGAGISEGIAYLVLRDLPGDALATFIVLWRTAVFYIPIALGGSVFSILAWRWSLSESSKSPEEVILPGDNDHNR